MKWLQSGTFAALTAATCVVGASEISAQEGTDTLEATLSGGEVVGGGDQDGRGTVSLRVSRDRDRLCYDLKVSGIEGATAARIHRSPVGREGPPVLTLAAPTRGASSDCLDAGRDLVTDLRTNPGDYYLSVYNPDFPRGAVRGQLRGS